jgi:uncharacterized protein (TIGR01319 family)
MPAALLIDFGSTYTKLRAVDLDARRVLAVAQGPSTVTTNVTIGLDLALAELERKLGRLPAFKHRLASSSAAGGLKMVTIGLVKELTAEAARQAALGAGAKLVGTFAYRLTANDMRAIESLEPDILLLAGGTDGGNAEVVRHNAERLAVSPLTCPIVVACNRDIAEDTATALQAAGKSAIRTDNVMPEFGVLNIDPARAAIREVFIDRIVHAKGIDRAAERFDAVLMPTPAAVMEGARLLSEGASRHDGLGDLLVVDIGGATTDVHSVGTGTPMRDGVVQYGLPEPFVKRTVEGDLGMRHNARTIAEAGGFAAFADRLGLSEARLNAKLDEIAADVERLPVNAEDEALDEALAWTAVRIAVARHAGTTEIVQTVHGPVTMQRGKDLTGVKYVIGTGGPLAHGATPASVLRAALADASDPFSLRPTDPALFIDADYLLYASGLLAAVDREAALALALGSLRPLQERDAHEHRSQIA